LPLVAIVGMRKHASMIPRRVDCDTVGGPVNSMAAK
jgi:hypothetical protein